MARTYVRLVRRMATSVTPTIELKLYMTEADEMEARHRVSRKKKNFPATGCKPGGGGGGGRGRGGRGEGEGEREGGGGGGGGGHVQRQVLTSPSMYQAPNMQAPPGLAR